MSTILNRNIIETSNFSNQLLGPFSFIVHKLSGEGDFIAEIYEQGRLISRFSIICSKDFRETQEHVDLSLANNQLIKNTLRLNNENGYVLFYNSKEYKDHQIVIKKGNTIEFDSTKPNSKDLFGLNLLKPGQYKLSSASLKTDLILDVKYPTLDEAQIGRATGSIQLDATKVLANKSQTILPNQGLVFNFADNFKDFKIEFVKENQPKVNKTIIDELKAKANLTSKKNKKDRVIKKYSLKK
jgi:hypothetical protein